MNIISKLDTVVLRKVFMPLSSKFQKLSKENNFWLAIAVRKFSTMFLLMSTVYHSFFNVNFDLIAWSFVIYLFSVFHNTVLTVPYINKTEKNYLEVEDKQGFMDMLFAKRAVMRLFIAYAMIPAIILTTKDRSTAFMIGWLVFLFASEYFIFAIKPIDKGVGHATR